METLVQKPSAFLKGGGEMGELTRQYNWTDTPLGPPSNWPISLRITVNTIINSRFPMFLWWGEEMIQFYNDAYRPSLGNNGKHPTALGQQGKECWPEIWHIIYPLIQQVQTTGAPTWQEDQLVPIYRNGKIEDVYWTYSYSSVLDDEGNHGGILVICTETTEKILNARQLEKNINNLNNIITQAPVAMCILNGPEYVIEIANDRMFELWGKERKDMLYKPIWEALPEAKNQGYEEMLNKVFLTGETISLNGSPVTLPRNGTVEQAYINFVYEPHRETDGTISGIMVVANDVTEQVLASKRVAESEAKFRLLADSMPQFVWAGDKEGNLNYFNQAVLEFSRMNEEAILSGGWKNVLHPDEIDECFHKWAHSVKTGQDFLLHHRFKNKEGNYIWQLSRAIPQRDHEGKITMWIGTSTDIHDDKLFEEKLQARIKEQTVELRMANEQLTRFNEELTRSNRNLEEFAYVASHDMKEPIRKIHFFSDKIQTLIADRMSEEEKKYFRRIDDASVRMNQLIDDLLTFSKLSVKPGRFEVISFDSILQDVLNDLELVIEQKKAVIQAEPIGFIYGHEGQLYHAIQNVLTNALKFNKPGIPPFVEISCRKRTAAELNLPLLITEQEKEFYEIIFSDNGIGFDPQESANIFNVFTRLHGNSEYLGTGIGLSIVKKVLENHNGFIRSESSPGNGARFIFYLPVA